MELNDDLNVKLIRQGDKEIFRKLFEIYYKRLLLYSRSYVGNTTEAEDIVQDLFYYIWENRKELIINTSISSYFFRAIHNRCIQFLRHKKVVTGYESRHHLKLQEAEILHNSSDDFTFNELKLKEIQDVFSNTNNTLPDKTREIFKLSREDSMSNKEIASLLKVQVKTIEYHITKALKTFHIALKDYFIFIFLI